jgi:hypothetical protein
LGSFIVGHQTPGAVRIEATVMLDNEDSARVLRKAGFNEEGVLRAYGYWKVEHHDIWMFSVMRQGQRQPGGFSAQSCLSRSHCNEQPTRPAILGSLHFVRRIRRNSLNTK